MIMLIAESRGLLQSTNRQLQRLIGWYEDSLMQAHVTDLQAKAGIPHLDTSKMLVNTTIR